MDKKKIFLTKMLIIFIVFLIGGLNVTQCLGYSIKKIDNVLLLTTSEPYLFDKLLTLEDFHDVAIKEITSPEVYIQPGTYDIKVIVVNNGTYPEYNLTCYLEIYEYITDPINGTLVYENEISDIDLDEPFGGTKLLNFNSYTFADEGIYKLFIDLPLVIDDFPEDNHKEKIIAVDDTEPESDYPPIFDPPEPNGENGWYVSDVTVSVSSTDPFSNGISSGIKEIRYTINGGAEQVLPGEDGSFILSESGDDILVEYWAIDNVGNVESPKNSFTIDIDKTTPEISLTYEIIGGNWYQGWDLELTAYAVEDMSGMAYMLIFLNDELVEIIKGPGPDYVWTLRYWPGQVYVIKIIACNNAGSCSVTFFNLSDVELTRFSKTNFINNFQNDLFNWLFNKHFLLGGFLRKINL